ncbi:MAG: hypothetical protein P9M00_00120 [Candidatus Tritonobacter lacicola]|nr:hypothetical protein [Candidatus Tritonobacter lacicola]
MKSLSFWQWYDYLFLFSLLILGIPIWLNKNFNIGIKSFFTVVLLLTLIIRGYYIFESTRKAKTIESLKSTIDTQEQDLEKYRKGLKTALDMAEPSKLSLLRENVIKTEEGYTVSLKFKPSKNRNLGAIVFTAKVINGFNIRIVDFWPTIEGGAFSSGPKSKEISEDGKNAKLTYQLLGVGAPTVELKISDRGNIIIQGNHLSEPVNLKVGE